MVVISEFGRTFRENGDRGTDHGHGSVYWVLGGGINGGRIVGEQVKVDQANLFQNRDYPGPDRLPRAVRRAVPAHVWARRREPAADLCRRPPRRIGVGVGGLPAEGRKSANGVLVGLVFAVKGANMKIRAIDPMRTGCLALLLAMMLFGTAADAATVVALGASNT